MFDYLVFDEQVGSNAALLKGGVSVPSLPRADQDQSQYTLRVSQSPRSAQLRGGGEVLGGTAVALV